MKLLVLTQIVEKKDANLGFFCAWLEKMSTRVDTLSVICLQKGDYSLPANVNVMSLGKESGASRMKYIKNFYSIIFKHRKDYDHVFVHMNPEYVVLGGLFWRVWGKKVLLWYTHKSVDLKLKIAEKLATKIFTVNEASFRLPSKKVEYVGHGIDTNRFITNTQMASLYGNSSEPIEETDKLRLLYVGRISSVKDLETIVLALDKLDSNVTIDIVGEAITDVDKEYERTVKELVEKLGLFSRVRFLGTASHSDLPRIYSSHDALLHTSRTGSVDKVVLEALANGLVVFSSSEAYTEFGSSVTKFGANNSEDLAKTIEKYMDLGIMEPNEKGREFVEKSHNLDNLIGKIVDYFGN
jgi:glycosyltransferase involved in cell wall biosynthesis